MRYIDADKAKAKLIEWLDSTGALPKGTSYYHECLSCIDDTPTESVVGAVRCKDCVAGEKTTLEPFVCSRNKMLVYSNSYCNYGIRRNI